MKLFEIIEKYRATTSLLVIAISAVYFFVINHYAPNYDKDWLNGLLGALFITILLINLLVSRIHNRVLASKVYSSKSRFYQDIRTIMEESLSHLGLTFGTLNFNKVITINDLINHSKNECLREGQINEVEKHIVSARVC